VRAGLDVLGDPDRNGSAPMIPEGAVAQLVQAFLFELLNSEMWVGNSVVTGIPAGSVIGRWGPTENPMSGSDGYGIIFRYPVAGPPFQMDDEEDAGWKLTASPGLRSMLLDGPRSQDGPVPNIIDRPGVLLDARYIDGDIRAHLYAGDPFDLIPPYSRDGNVATFRARRTGETSGTLVAEALIQAGRTLLELSEDDNGGGTPIITATLKRGDAGTARELATIETLAAPTASQHNGTETGRAYRIGITDDIAVVVWHLNIDFAAGQGPTGDMQITLPVAGLAGTRPVGSGMSSSSIGRVPLTVSAISAGGSVPLIRPNTYNGAAAGLAPVVVHATAMNNAIMGTWGAGTWVSCAGSYVVE
jgi:hypothetical protein